MMTETKGRLEDGSGLHALRWLRAEHATAWMRKSLKTT
jgi:hypothetical protein